MKYPDYKKPKTKGMLVPYINEERTAVHFGGNQANIAREIETETPELLIKLLKLLDGKNNLEFVSKSMNVPYEEIREVIDVLYESGVISENDASQYNFSDDEVEIYTRNIGFYEWLDVKPIYYNYWELQNKLKTSTVLLLGAGGTGSIAAKQLARLGVGNIILVDKDVVEKSNLNRQDFDYCDLGLKKVEAVAKYVKRANPFVKVLTVEKFIKSEKDILEITDKFSPQIVISCIDKPDNINDILCKFTKKTHIPWIMGGYASTIMNHAIFYHNSESYMSILNNTTYNIFEGKALLDNINNWKWDNSIISPISTISGAISVFYCFAFLSGIVDLKPSKLIHLDFYNISDLENFMFCI